MTRATLLALAERVEAATTTEQREMLEAAFVAVHGPKPERVHGGSPEWHAWLDLHNPFFRKLAAEAYESAAMSLVPCGWNIATAAGQNDNGTWFSELRRGYRTSYDAVALSSLKCATPALALTAAACRAIAGSLPD